MSNLMIAANGRWFDILSKFINSKFLTNKHGACPLCNAGVDRFRWDDRLGNGSYFCSVCGSGSGLHLLAQHQGLSHKEAAKLVYSFLPECKQTAKKPEVDKLERVKKLWAKREKLTEGDCVSEYLASRGIKNAPKTLHKAHHGVFIGEVWQPYVAMIAKAVIGSKAVGVHLTYLDGGKKANIEKSRECYSVAAGALNGAAIRLHEAGEKLLIAEGIETALSASQIFGIPAWSAINAGGMEKVIIPEFVKEVIICADRDLNYTGQSAAYNLAKRLTTAGLKVEVRLPDIEGDWNDILMSKLKL